MRAMLRYLSKRPELKVDDPAMVYHCRVGQLRVLPQMTAENRLSSQLPSKLLMKPGFYTFEDYDYDCSVPGLYRFSKPRKRNEQRVVVYSNDGFQTALCLSMLLIRGNQDDQLGLNEMIKWAKHRLLVNTCGRASEFVDHLLRESGFKCRIVNTRTKGAFNSYNNGHIMVEVYDKSEQRYRLIDVDKKCYFLDKDGRELDLFEFCRLLNSDQEVRIKRAAPSALVDWTGFEDAQTGVSYQFIEQMVAFNEQTALDLYRRISAIPVLDQDRRRYATSWPTIPITSSDHAELVFLSPEDFRRRLY